MAPGELSSTNCQKGLSTIRLGYPVSGTVLAGTGFKKMGGYPTNRISGTSLFPVSWTAWTFGSVPVCVHLGGQWVT